MGQTTIKCPQCHAQIDINEALYDQLENEYKSKWQDEQKKFQQEMEKQQAEYKNHLNDLKRREEDFQAQQEHFQDKLRDAVYAQLQLEKEKLRDSLKQEVQLEQAGAIELLRKELETKSKEVIELHHAKAQIEALKRSNEEIVAKAKANAQIELTQQLQDQKEKIRKSLDLEYELKLKEKEKQLQDQKRLTDEMKRKMEQGSMQLQGEVQELAIEEWLSNQFPFDSINEIKKGAYGADCIQIVHTRELQNCGKICYESKNTKAWSDNWIDKFKQDILTAKADIGVLVTSVYPAGMERMGFVSGIWVCSLEEFKGSAALLRQSLINTHKVTQRNENKGDKMTLLYNYLTSNEFNMQLQSIVDGFITMQDELEREKRSITASWKRRQKLIDSVLLNTTDMYGSLQGIAGNALPHVAALEFHDNDQ